MPEESFDVILIPSPKEPIHPHNIAELLQYLRLRRHLSTYQLAKLIRYSQQSIHSYETVLRNPTLKTLMHYIQYLHLELNISSSGITIRDITTGSLIVENWNTNFR